MTTGPSGGRLCRPVDEREGGRVRAGHSDNSTGTPQQRRNLLVAGDAARSGGSGTRRQPRARGGNRSADRRGSATYNHPIAGRTTIAKAQTAGELPTSAAPPLQILRIAIRGWAPTIRAKRVHHPQILRPERGSATRCHGDVRVYMRELAAGAIRRRKPDSAHARLMLASGRARRSTSRCAPSSTSGEITPDEWQSSRPLPDREDGRCARPRSRAEGIWARPCVGDNASPQPVTVDPSRGGQPFGAIPGDSESLRPPDRPRRAPVAVNVPQREAVVTAVIDLATGRAIALAGASLSAALADRRGGQTASTAAPDSVEVTSPAIPALRGRVYRIGEPSEAMRDHETGRSSSARPGTIRCEGVASGIQPKPIVRGRSAEKNQARLCFAAGLLALHRQRVTYGANFPATARRRRAARTSGGQGGVNRDRSGFDRFCTTRPGDHLRAFPGLSDRRCFR